jgi:bla regulator protein BlaR1
MIEPGIFGILRPVLMLPEGILERLTPEQLRAIVAHEMCHVRRRDNLTFAVHMIVEALFWFHPAVWWIGARLIEERERACDEAVLLSGSEAEIYAEGILNVCKFYVESPLECVAGVTGSDLKRRIVRIMTRHGALRLNFSRKFLLCATGLVVMAAPVTFGLVRVAQERAQANSGDTNKRTFDAASVRTSTQPFVFKGVDFLNPVGDEAPPRGGLFSWNVSLPWLINFAYDLRSSQERRGAREALPKWSQDEWYTIEARAEGNPTRDDVRQMVRSLLEDRFQFAAHLEKREGQAYALMVARPGLGLKPHAEGSPCTLSSLKVHTYPHTDPSYDAVPAHCGIFNRELSHSGDRRSEMLDVTMQQIADSLGLGLSSSVIDHTGLTGRYDAVLDFGPEQTPPNADSSSDEIGLPPLRIALEKQLGLKLVKQNDQVEVFVIDHVERPSPN